MKLKIQFLRHTSHISRAEEPHVASGCYWTVLGRADLGHFHHCRKCYWMVMLWNDVSQSGGKQDDCMCAWVISERQRPDIQYNFCGGKITGFSALSLLVISQRKKSPSGHCAFNTR